MNAGNNGGIVKRNSSFEDAGVTAENVERIELIGNPYKSFDPKEEFNSYREGFRINDKVIVVVKTFIDLDDVVAQDISESSTTTPEAPSLVVNYNDRTITASHPLGDSQIEVSINNGFYAAYTGPVSVGNSARAEGYFKFRSKAAAGRNASPAAISPVFYIAGALSHYSSFAGTDDTLLTSYTPDAGSAWELVEGSFKLSGNKAVTSGAAGSPNNNYYARTPVSPGANYKTAAVAETSNNGMFRQLLLKMNEGTTDGIVINISETYTDVIELTSGNAITTTMVIPGPILNGLASALFEVTVNGNSLTIKKDDVAYVKTTDNSQTSVAIGTHIGSYFGIGNSNGVTPVAGAVKFDSFKVDPL